MANEHPDVGLARAEAQLDRLDELTSERESRTPVYDRTVTREFSGDGFHVEEAADADVDDDPDTPHVSYDGAEAVIDGFNEAFNARDVDAVLEACAEDVEAPGLAGDAKGLCASLEQLWERRPNVMLTRGELDDRVVSVMWEIGEGGAWWRVAPIYFDIEDGAIAVIELDDDRVALDAIITEAPEAEFEEGSTWQEWEDGVPAD